MAIIDRRCRSSLALPAVLLLVASPPAAAAAEVVPDPRGAAAIAAEVLVRGGYQQSAPGMQQRMVDEAPLERREAGRTGPAPASPREGGTQGSASTPLAVPWGIQVLLIAGFAALGLFVLYRAWPKGRAREHVPERSAAVHVRGPAPRPEDDPTLEAADRLAASGSVGDAVHHLLQAALARLRRTVASAASPSWTAREILRRLDLPARARAALAILVESAERDRFGGRPSSAATYRACRACYLRLAALTGFGSP